MENGKWLMKELDDWIDAGLIDEETARGIRMHYRRDSFRVPLKTPLFFAAVAGVLVGILFLGASFWNELSQDNRFFLSLAPACVTLLFLLGFFFWDRDEKSESAERASFSVTLRESLCTLHGIGACLSLWLVLDTYRLNAEMFLLGIIFSAVFLVLSYFKKSAGLSTVAVFLAVVSGGNGAHEAWPAIAAWILLALSLPQLLFLILQEREDAAIGYAWCFAAAILLLSYVTGVAPMWQAIFFTTVASSTWLFGAGMKRNSRIGELFRFLGAMSLTAALLVDSYSATWQSPDENMFLWILFGLFLVANGYLLRISVRKKEWLASVSGLSPFVVGLAAFASWWDASGVLSAMTVTMYALALGALLIVSGLHTGRRRQLLLGIFVLGSGGLVRLADSTMSLAQRGVYFLFLGLGAALFCYALSAAGKRAVARHGYDKEESEGGDANE